MFGNKPDEAVQPVEDIPSVMTAGQAYAEGLLDFKPVNPDEPVQAEWLDKEGRARCGFADPNANA